MKYLKTLYNWQTMLVCLIALELLIFGSMNPRFVNIYNLLYSIGDFLYIAIAALPMTMIIVSGGIDISIGSVMGLSAVCTGLVWIGTNNIWLAVIAGLLGGGLAGALNGVLIVITHVNPLVITLGSSFLYAGAALTLSGLAGTSGFEGIGGFPDGFVNIANGTLFTIPNPVWILLALVIIFYVLLHHTKFGRYLFLIGMNSEAAKYTGINVNKLLIINYTISGLGGATAGILLSSYFTSARSDLGADAPLTVITCAVLGGANIYGGEGRILGAVLASLLIGYLKYGLQMVHITAHQTSVFLGLLLIISISGVYFWRKYNELYKNRKAFAQLQQQASGGLPSADA
ncbi:autoinducer 2 import system permease LsrD [candidate division KSB3 bacterium]|uniref:Autoinducer 2 import system permease protein LsrD n=1 Tax=candidate division KSB3 bacterium TaxID=2044937 RepID=A0A2G6E334_9BACT|nr:MAG: autoinducer 2 import system permease LsrD [candidate division KSB3 bacterium]PIE28895.1 MAG: autoinducer 2 import system permease LsrD [candidate division KSB3 bacterium]